MQSDAVHDGGHAKFAHTVVDVTAHLAFVVLHHIACQVDAQGRCGRCVGEVRARKVGRAAQHFGQGRRESFQGQLAGFATGHGFGFGVRCNDSVHSRLCKVFGQLAFHAAHKFFGQCGVRCFVACEGFVPFGFASCTTLLGIPVGIHIFWNDERRVRPT